MQVSRVANNCIQLFHIYASALVCLWTKDMLWRIEPWFTIGWHRTVSYLMAGVIAGIVFGLPTFWLRRRYLQVEGESSDG